MFRLPVRSGRVRNSWLKRHGSSSSFIRNSFIDYFVKNHDHKLIKSSSVVPLSDPSVPFVNAGMIQFKGIFLGKVDAPCPRAVNSQKCVRVGGKHNDLDVVGTDGHHHTFFEMLGNWSFGDYYKKEACKMAWELLLGPYQLKPENLVVTYFSGDAVIGLKEDTECRDIWKAIGVPASQIRPQGAADNFWEMGATGPCGPCTEIHYVNPDGSLTEIWNIVFIQCNRVSETKLSGLRQYHVDTGMGLERMAAILQKVPSNYDTDLFKPIIRSIEDNSKGAASYSGSYNPSCIVDAAYRRLADHARMVAVCLADEVYPATSLNLKQIIRKSLKLSTDVFNNPSLLNILYDQVSETLGEAYPELVGNRRQAKLILEHEQQAYARLRSDLAKKWKNLESRYPEVQALADVELPGFTQGYAEFKQTMSKQKSTLVPGELVFKLYDTHGFQEDLIDRIAKLNNFEIDRKGFWGLLTKHKTRHKASIQEQTDNKSVLFDKAIQEMIDRGTKCTDDSYKYDYKVENGKLKIETLKTHSIALLNEDCEWVDFIDPDEERPFYLVTKDTNFYCEEGGQISDSGVIRCNNDNLLEVDTVFKIRDFVFHKGQFKVNKNLEVNFISADHAVELNVDSEKRLNIMRNHTGVHLVNAAIRKVLPNSVFSQTGSSVTDKGLSLSLSVYGEKLSHDAVIQAQDLICNTIKSGTPVHTKVIDSVQLPLENDVTKIPGERYPEQGLRLVSVDAPGLVSRELCCGTHVSSTSDLVDICITVVKGGGGNAPTIHALTGEAATEVQELFCKAQKLSEVVQLTDPVRCKQEAAAIKRKLAELCGSNGAPYGQYALCLSMLDNLHTKAGKADIKLNEIASAEIAEATAQALDNNRKFVVHFLRCSYLMSSEGVSEAMGGGNCGGGKVGGGQPALLLGCAGGVIRAVCTVPKEMTSSSFTASRWLRCILPIFNAELISRHDRPGEEFAEMSPTKVSLINCENLVQDAMRVAIKFAQAHMRDAQDSRAHTQDRRHN